MCNKIFPILFERKRFPSTEKRRLLSYDILNTFILKLLFHNVVSKFSLVNLRIVGYYAFLEINMTEIVFSSNKVA